MQARVNSLTSAETELPFNYNSLPFCEPPEGACKYLGTVNLGSVLSGPHIESWNSPYNFSLLVEEHGKAACKGPNQENSYGPLTDEEAHSLKDKIRSRYRVKLMLDNLPVTPDELDEENPGLMRQGIDIGSEDNGTFYVNNHIMFKILVHRTNRTDHRDQLPRAESRMNFAELEAVNVVEAEAVKAETINIVDIKAEGGARRLLTDSENSKPAGVTSETAENSETIEVVPEIGGGPKKSQMTIAEAVEAFEAEVVAAFEPEAEAKAEAEAASNSEGRAEDVLAVLEKVDDLEHQIDPAFMVVRFEALACSIKRDPNKPIDKKLSCFAEGNPDRKVPDKQPVETGADIVYTYDVFWENSKASWASRWDALV